MVQTFFFCLQHLDSCSSSLFLRNVGQTDGSRFSSLSGRKHDKQVFQEIKLYLARDIRILFVLLFESALFLLRGEGSGGGGLRTLFMDILNQIIISQVRLDDSHRSLTWVKYTNRLIYCILNFRMLHLIFSYSEEYLFHKNIWAIIWYFAKFFSKKWYLKYFLGRICVNKINIRNDYP